jgi:hypothetical protein
MAKGREILVHIFTPQLLPRKGGKNECFFWGVLLKEDRLQAMGKLASML